MNILVTGATGFLGKNAVNRLLKEGHSVTAVGRNRAEGERLGEAGAAFLQLDLASSRMREAIARHDAVFHCGALSSPWGKYRDFYASNVIGTRNVIQGCLEHGVQRLVHVSTPSIYFDYRHRFNIAEHEPLPKSAVNHYAATKLLAEQEVDRAFREQGLRVVTIRPRALFGPGDTAIFPRLLRANDKRFIPMFGSGQPLVDITYVDNVTEALMRCLYADPIVLGQKYNITNGEPIQLWEAMTRLFELLNKPMRTKKIAYPAAYTAASLLELGAKLPGLAKEPLLTRYTVGILAFSQTLSIEKAQRELGYRPLVSVEEGLRRFAAWWKEQEETR
ncbi:NAD dependent epimerase/dehydratase family protein [Paenibacillus algorifonticola]|uniref:NAD dependent epimerase/dehydratase family protein n=1 Tax=Paenibacillus algorifonticola TaxID=684063 RepID=A0A1I2IEL0_9BACL|nr:NAD(P)-dependent oxidoreductase [Paenibacillus algorifonticola]SFF40779.1 NAD dependent epimerase/dehydratase family protein [Paenibacillus algorifonticola]